MRELWRLWVIFGLFGLELGVFSLSQFYMLNVSGTIVASKDIPYAGAPRYASIYKIQSGTKNIHTYTAGPTDSSLPRSIPVGTRIEKNKYSILYKLNGVVQTSKVKVAVFAGTIAAVSFILAFGFWAFEIRRKKLER